MDFLGFDGQNGPIRDFTVCIIRCASFFFGVRIMLGMTFNYLILWVRVKGQA